MKPPKVTEDEWVAVKTGTQKPAHGVWHVNDQGGGLVAECWSGTEQAETNARMLAASKKLAEALHAIVEAELDALEEIAAMRIPIDSQAPCHLRLTNARAALLAAGYTEN